MERGLKAAVGRLRLLSQRRTFQATHLAHGGKNRRLHLDVTDTGVSCFPQVIQLIFLSVGAKGAVQTALPCTIGETGREF